MSSVGVVKDVLTSSFRYDRRDRVKTRSYRQTGVLAPFDESSRVSATIFPVSSMPFYFIISSLFISKVLNTLHPKFYSEERKEEIFQMLGNDCAK